MSHIETLLVGHLHFLINFLALTLVNVLDCFYSYFSCHRVEFQLLFFSSGVPALLTLYMHAVIDGESSTFNKRLLQFMFDKTKELRCEGYWHPSTG